MINKCNKMETYTCKTTIKQSECLQTELEASEVIYNDLILNDGVYTIYCTRMIANNIKNKGYKLVEE